MTKYLAKGIEATGRSKAYKQRKAWAVKKKNQGKFPQHEKKQEEVKKAVEPKFYPADDVKVPLKRRHTNKIARLRPSITPGTVLILLAGRFKGKRVIFLKQLASGMLLITGPYKVNGVPVRRVNQAFVIATSTKVELKEVDLSPYSDDYFKRTEKKKAKKSEEDFFKEDAQKKALPTEYIENQKKLDQAVMACLKDELKGYLASRFTLRDGDKPHLMKF